MSVWPVFVCWAMYRDDPVPLQAGDEVSWDVRMIDGQAEGWPTEILIPTTVHIAEPPPGARHGTIAATPQLRVAWGGKAPLGSRFQIHGALSADWLNPPFKTTITGPIKRLHIAWTRTPANGFPGAPMRLVQTHEVIRTLRRSHDPAQTIAGLVAEINIRASEISAFNQSH